MESKNLIIIEQLPVIKEQLKELSAYIDERISSAKMLECTDDTIKEIKALRADLTKEFNSFEARRKEVKNAVLSPYEAFEEIYKMHVSSKYRQADADLKADIERVENERKAQKESEVRKYLDELLVFVGLKNFITWEMTGIRVGLSDSVKSLKQRAKTLVDKMLDDISLIDTQEHKDEILCEYKIGLNVSKAIQEVKTRHARIEACKKDLNQIMIEETTGTESELIDSTAFTPPEIVKNEPVGCDEKEYAVRFRVTATKAKLQELKKFLINGGYKYE